MDIRYALYNITEIHKIEIKELVDKNLSSKMDSYLLPYIQKGSMMSLVIKIEKNKRNRYDGLIRLNLDKKHLLYKTNVNGFQIVADVVNHDFDRFKEQLSHK